MAIPDYQKFMLPVLRLAAKGEQRVGIAAERIADELGLSDGERGTMLPSGRQRLLNNRIHWAKLYMSKAGLISSPSRGLFVATEQGLQLLATKPSQINVALLMKYPAFIEFYKGLRKQSLDGSDAVLNDNTAKPGGLPSPSVSAASRPTGPHRPEFAFVFRAADYRSARRDEVRRVA
jgi:restriction system protein